MTALDWSIPRNDAPARDLVPPCRCGWVDDKPMGIKPVRVPVRDLRDTFGVAGFEVSPTRRTCASCTHPIGAGMSAVVHRLTNPGSVLNRYHPECVEIR